MKNAKSYTSNILYAVACFGFAAYMVWQAVTGQGGALTWASAAIIALAGALFLGAYFKLKRLDREDGDGEDQEKR